MFYYGVWVRSGRYHSSEPLTYASVKRLAIGQIVQVELQKEQVLGLVSGSSSKPRFQTKPIVRVFNLPEIPGHLLRLGRWLGDYYPTSIGNLTQQFLPINISEKQLASEPLTGLGKSDFNNLPELTIEQKEALDSMSEYNSYILHGITGSGKTRLYIEMANQAIENGQSAIILTPEISLTSQLADNFRKVFGERVIVMHSQQAPSERQKAWLDCLQTIEPLVVVGPRSALFSPLSKVGLIVLDEAHETAYKQEQSPQYQTGRVAAQLATLTHSRLILGTATPSVSDYYIAQQKDKPIIKLSHLAESSEQAPREIIMVDRKQRDQFIRSNQLSQPLIKAVEVALSRGEQSLLYLNRRGTARLVLCEKCGWQADCPHCDVPLTYHGDHHVLICHSCDYRANAPSSCPNCGHTDIIYRTAGTKAIVSEVENLFPGARVARFDTDNLKAERFEQHYKAAKSGKIDILVGTQLLAKGLDLPHLSTLGILLADTSLYLPDFSAQERTFQLISQVLGRIGRGHVAGRAIIQTYHPDHPVLVDAIENNYQSFYQTELASRKQYMFPPFCYLLKLSVRRASIKSAEKAATDLKAEIQNGGYQVLVEGPAPSFYERIKNKYQWQLVIKAKQRGELIKIIKHLPSGWSSDLDPLDLL
jgi:primosomal protein N' (replication factor Y)